jgi:hypothetical protein
MKKILLTLGFGSLVALSSFAQGPAAGRLFVMGSVGYSSEKGAGADAKATGTLTFAPGAGYFLNDNIALGAKLIFKSASNSGKSAGSTFGLGAFGRYYITKDVLGAKGSFFADATLSYTSEKGGDADAKATNTIGLGVGPGFALFPTPKLGFEITLPNVLGFYSSSNDGKAAGSGFGIGASTISGPQMTVIYFIK